MKFYNNPSRWFSPFREVQNVNYALDRLSHPDLRRMTMRELADLPLTPPPAVAETPLRKRAVN